MQLKSSPLTVIINPPGLLEGMPGDTLELDVLVTNQGNQEAVIDVFLDEASLTLSQWCSSTRERIGLAPKHSNEVSFQFQIPHEALSNKTYDYTLVVDAPDHYPQDTPLQYPLQLKVLLKPHSVVQASDPTFRLQPTTNPSYPATIKPSEPLMVEVTVQNRSNRVDNFRLTCLDLEPDWFTIRYPKTGLEGPGLLSEPDGLSLNPAAFGTILLEIHPPADTLAGNYSPTIRLHSANSPSLVLLDLVYIYIPASYRLDVQLNTLRGISRSSGQYEIKLANRGNTVRELAISAKSRDEEELCTYQCDPSQVRLLPGRTVGVKLTVTPSQWWRRSLWGAGLNLNFQVELQDCQKSPLTENLPQGTLVWKARPWWQFLLLVLAILGLIGGIALVIRLIFFKSERLQITTFKSDSFLYTEGNRVFLSWEIHNPKQLQKLVLKSQKLVSNQGTEVTNEVTYQFNGHVFKELNNLQPPPCNLERQELSCNRVVETGAQKPGNYTFVLEAFDSQGNILGSDKVEGVNIKAKPAPEVNNIHAERPQYKVGEQVLLSWEIQNSDQLSNLTIFTTENGTRVGDPVVYTPDDLKSLCEPQKQLLTCKEVPVTIPTRPGKYAFEFQVSSTSTEQPPAAKEPELIEVESNAKIVYFKLIEENKTWEPPANVTLQVGTPFSLEWKVLGEGVTVRLNDSNVNASGSKPFDPYKQPGQRLLRLEVLDQSRHTIASASFYIEVVPSDSSATQSPSPSPTDSSADPSPNTEQL